MFRQQWCKWTGDGIVMVAGSNLATVFVFFRSFFQEDLILAVGIRHTRLLSTCHVLLCWQKIRIFIKFRVKWYFCSWNDKRKRYKHALGLKPNVRRPLSRYFGKRGILRVD